MNGLLSSLRGGDVVVLGQWAVVRRPSCHRQPLKLTKGFVQVLSLFTASTAFSTTAYNLPILLFGLVTYEIAGEGGSKLFRMFSMFLLTTLFLDFLSLLSPSGGLFNTLLTLLLIGIKTIMYFSSMRVLEERGASWRWDPRAVMESARGVVPTQGGSGFAAPSSMPGGFTTTPGSNTDNNASTNNFPSSGGFVLGSGGAEDDVERQQATGAGAPGRGGYQSLP